MGGGARANGNAPAGGGMQLGHMQGDGRGAPLPHSGVVPLAEPPAKRQKTFNFKVGQLFLSGGVSDSAKAFCRTRLDGQASTLYRLCKPPVLVLGLCGADCVAVESVIALCCVLS